MLIIESRSFQICGSVRAVVWNSVHIEVAALKPRQSAVHVKRASGLQREQRIQFPSAENLFHHAFFWRRQIPHARKSKAMADVEFGWSAIELRLADVRDSRIERGVSVDVEVVAEISFGDVVENFSVSVIRSPHESVAVVLAQRHVHAVIDRVAFIGSVVLVVPSGIEAVDGEIARCGRTAHRHQSDCNPRACSSLRRASRRN